MQRRRLLSWLGLGLLGLCSGALGREKREHMRHNKKGNKSNKSEPVTLFLCGDVMTGRGIDQILPYPSSPEIHDPYMTSAQDRGVSKERKLCSKSYISRICAPCCALNTNNIAARYR